MATDLTKANLLAFVARNPLTKNEAKLIGIPDQKIYNQIAVFNESLEILGLQDADIINKSAIKKKYVRLAFQLHPNKEGDPEEFKKINMANEFLNFIIEKFVDPSTSFVFEANEPPAPEPEPEPVPAPARTRNTRSTRGKRDKSHGPRSRAPAPAPAPARDSRSTRGKSRSRGSRVPAPAPTPNAAANAVPVAPNAVPVPTPPPAATGTDPTPPPVATGTDPTPPPAATGTAAPTGTTVPVPATGTTDPSFLNKTMKLASSTASIIGKGASYAGVPLRQMWEVSSRVVPEAYGGVKSFYDNNLSGSAHSKYFDEVIEKDFKNKSEKDKKLLKLGGFLTYAALYAAGTYVAVKAGSRLTRRGGYRNRKNYRRFNTRKRRSG